MKVCGKCRYWSEMCAQSIGCAPIEALCLAPDGLYQGKWVAERTTCDSWKSGHHGAVDGPPDYGRVARERYDAEEKTVNYASDQEKLWAGAFGDNYTARNTGPELLASNVEFLRRALKETGWLSKYRGDLRSYYCDGDVPNVVEFGANRGNVIRALMDIGFPSWNMTAVEINTSAADELREIPDLIVHNNTMFEDKHIGTFNLVISRGLLIHIPPEHLNDAYDVLVCSLKRFGYLLVGEYFAPEETEVKYRGLDEALWRRNYGKELIERHGLELVDYGFVADIDPVCPQDNINWWLLRKK